MASIRWILGNFSWPCNMYRRAQRALLSSVASYGTHIAVHMPVEKKKKTQENPKLDKHLQHLRFFLCSPVFVLLSLFLHFILIQCCCTFCWFEISLQHRHFFPPSISIFIVMRKCFRIRTCCWWWTFLSKSVRKMCKSNEIAESFFDFIDIHKITLSINVAHLFCSNGNSSHSNYDLLCLYFTKRRSVSSKWKHALDPSYANKPLKMHWERRTNGQRINCE